MEPVTLVRSTARVFSLRCSPKTSFSTCKSFVSPLAHHRFRRFPASGRAPARNSRTPGPDLSIIRSLGSLVSCRCSAVRRWLSGGLDGGSGIDGGDVVRCGGLGTLLLSTTASVVSRARASPFIGDLAANPTFVSGLVFLNFFVERKWDLRMLFSSGGMPSSHSALCTALSASVALCHGAGDALFPVCLGFSLIVMYDAIGVRRHAGMQAAVLNMIVQDLFEGHPISQRKLKELLGHTPSQVIAGALLGSWLPSSFANGGSPPSEDRPIFSQL
ncbi:unnamed protein product [Spirodela intermedia]|uniref:Uncharacterized protein n=1 Tax=Spirodela intermedia TaxID=51605 RepID=A0A7I8IVD3_SPIIN|nr:unnamed protein product [Spirodela intermedia]CAA6661108.1 unnamed protein product [Spirodela intermedia]